MKTQQEECYAGEAHLERGRVFPSVTDAQHFVDALRNTPWWTAHGFHLAVPRTEVGAAGEDKTMSVGWFDKDMGAGRVELTSGGMCERVVLHEVAHVLASAKYSSKSHDPWWAKTYLTLVACVMGSDAYLALQRGFDTHRVDYAVNVTPSHVIAL